jgi:predicted metal-dependent hydrolase
MQLNDDPRFTHAIAQFNAGEFYEAADGFEELFFEAVRDELELVRVLMQVSVGAYHADTGQRRPAVERLDEAILAIDRATNHYGLDLVRLRQDIKELIGQIRAGTPKSWPRISQRGESGG